MFIASRGKDGQGDCLLLVIDKLRLLRLSGDIWSNTCSTSPVDGAVYYSFQFYVTYGLNYLYYEFYLRPLPKMRTEFIKILRTRSTSSCSLIPCHILAHQLIIINYQPYQLRRKQKNLIRIKFLLCHTYSVIPNKIHKIFFTLKLVLCS